MNYVADRLREKVSGAELNDRRAPGLLRRVLLGNPESLQPVRQSVFESPLTPREAAGVILGGVPAIAAAIGLGAAAPAAVFPLSALKIALPSLGVTTGYHVAQILDEKAAERRGVVLR